MARKSKVDDETATKTRSTIDELVDAIPDEPVKSDVELIKISNVGPIASAVIAIPRTGGGVLVLKGDSGTGKSEAISMIDALLTKTGKLIPRDLAAKGQVTGFDRTINVGGTTTRKGEGEVNTLDPSKFTFADLVEPTLAGLEQRHARRIQALIGLSGVAPNLLAFLEVVGGQSEYDKLLSPKDQATRDPVTLAGKIKDAIDAQARELQTLIDNDVVNQKAAEAAAKDVDLSAPHDATHLQDALVRAANLEATLKHQRATYEEAAQASNESQAKLDAQSGDVQGRLTYLREQRTASEDKRASVSLARAKQVADIALIKEQLAKAEGGLKTIDLSIETIDSGIESIDLQLAELNNSLLSVAGWQSQVDAIKSTKNPTDLEIFTAEEAVTQARFAVDEGSKVRTAIEKKLEAEAIAVKNKKREKVVSMLRDKAKNVFSALSEMIPKGPLYVVAGELVADTDDREAEPYERLSTGERWFLALPYAINAVGDGGYICVPQDAWQHLSPTAKPHVARLCQEAGVWLITGEVTTGELRSEVYQPTA